MLSPDFVRYLSEVLGVMAHVPNLWRLFSTPQMGMARSEGEDLIFGLSNPDCVDTRDENKTTPKLSFAKRTDDFV